MTATLWTTSATDAQSERLIHEALLSFVRGRTTFLITRAVTPGVLELVHKVAVMDHGQLIAIGPHEAVLATCPVYERLFHARGRRERIFVDAQEPATLSGVGGKLETKNLAFPASSF